MALNQNQASKITSYRDLIVWQKAMDLVVATYRLSKKLPISENYGLVSQMQRAAVSIPSNVAEGHGRKHLGEYLQHLSVANGSLKELETHLLLANRLGYLDKAETESVLKSAEEIGSMLAGLIRSLRRRNIAVVPKPV